MARSDLLVNLVKAGSVGDQKLLRATVEALIAEERHKQHNVLAESLQKALSPPPPTNGNGHAKSIDSSERGKDFLAEVFPNRRLEDLVLPQLASTACLQLVEEQQRADLLRSHGLEPRHRILLVGPPGNGKTSLAEAIAESLAVPLLVVRYEAMIGSYLGETAGRLKRVFDYVRARPCVLFFDEFDAVGKERGDTHETGEIKRVVTSLLMQVDDLPSYTVVVAATNHAELLDRAVWRRFQLRIELPSPTLEQRAAYIDRFFQRFDEPAGLQGRTIARKLGSLSFAEIEQFCLDVTRRQVLSLGESDLKKTVAEQMAIWGARVSRGGSAGTQGDKNARSSSSKAARCE